MGADAEQRAHPGPPPRREVDDRLWQILDGYRAAGPAEEADVAELRSAATGDVWSRSAPLHVTGSALVVHRPSGRVLLRWHAGLERWLQVGGHADPGERDPWVVARREAEEETGLADLSPLGRPGPVQIAVVDVPAGRDGPAHRHADIRYLLATAHPGSAVAEDGRSPLRWLPINEAVDLTAEANLRVLLERAAAALA
jgi:8-oxo-dGTP pyrophosphatase MutT (NUDIX family)